MKDGVACDRCGRVHSGRRLWCPHCGADVRRENDSDFGRAEAELASSADLYERVLTDLERLRQQGESPTPTYGAIKEFYSARLRTVVAAQCALEQVRRLGPPVRAEDSALEETHCALQRAISQFPTCDVLRDMAGDVAAEITRRKVFAIRQEAVGKWLAAAEACADLNEAEKYLQQAQAVDPDNVQVADRLEKLRRQRERLSATAEMPRGPARDATVELQPLRGEPLPAPAAAVPSGELAAVATSFAEEEEPPSSMQRFLEAASEWSAILKPFLLDNVGWFVGAFLIVAGFVVLIAAFWRDIGANPVLMRSMVFWSLAVTTGVFFGLAYYMRSRYPRLETSSNVLLIIVALLIPLVFAAAAVTTLAPTATEMGLAPSSQRSS